ncbi:integrin alpha-L-like isoform X2 [Rhinoderma darwinii]|uniref:integrin alpha-L-like isoform X2 n=1 Tax=Rhinoderma darwinii TaxID=43563 RepID=UPI003F67548D
MALVACRWPLVILSLLEAVDVSSSYNVEVSSHRRFSAEGSSLFGYRVVQFPSRFGQRVLIGDPGTSKLYACDVSSQKCQNIVLPNQNVTSKLGLTLEVEPLSRRCLVCGFEEPHDCSKTLYTNGACYTVDSTLSASDILKPGYQECQKAEVDLCFLFDDGYSMGELELDIVKTFLLSTIRDLKNSSMNFAVVQFAGQAQKVFDFKDYQLGKSEERITEMKHKGGLTNTYKAIRFTLEEIFTPEAGVREQAKKILLILTDGDVNDDDDGVIETADKQQVTRYIIGVGKNFDLQLQTNLASYPLDKHTQVMNDYSYLESFFKELQTKILAIEGVAQGSNFSREMSSAGLSAAFAQDLQILGDPGIYDWSGGILDLSQEEKPIYMSSKEEDKYGYLGYAVKLFRTGGGLFCVVGAPRYQYLGLLTVLQEVSGERRWKKIYSLLGKQVGSYFGAEIAVSDLDQDGGTDLVLISAPHYYELKWSGQVSVCHFTEDTLECTLTLHGEPGHLQSQFGAAVSSLQDLDGDGFTEVAVGAPNEMDGGGALYIYKGKSTGLSAAYSQRLISPPGIRGFGLSIHGVLDMTLDGLIDVVVGSWGHVTLHRSQPLLQVNVSVTSSQTYMIVSSLEASGCNNELTLEACVRSEILTPKYTGSLNTSVQYSLVLDSQKPKSRMFFTNKQRQMNETIVIQSRGLQCRNYTILLQDCSLDDVSEVQVSLVAFPEHDVDSRWLLSPSSNLMASDLIFFRMCEEGEICGVDLSINLNHSQLLAQDGAAFSVFLRLHNMGEKTHHTRLSVTVPAGLSFRKANVTEASHWSSLEDIDFKEQILTFNVGHPFLRRGVWAVIQIMFGTVSNVSWADHIVLAVSVSSDDYGNKTSISEEFKVPVLYPLHVISRSLEDSTKYVPIMNQNQRKTAAHRYQIQNLGLNTVPVNLSISVSLYEAWKAGVIWSFNISSPQDPGVFCSMLNDSSAVQIHSKEPETNASRQAWGCIMDGFSEMNIHITGLLRATHEWKVERSVSVRSAVMIQYNELRYHSDMGNMFHAAQVVTQVELLVAPDHTFYIAGGTAGGLIVVVLISLLLYKCGFFKRYKDRMMDAPSSDPQTHASPEGENNEAAGKLIEPREQLTSACP